MKKKAPRARILVAIKLLHTLIWACLVACILAIPIAAAQERFDRAAVLSGIILVECLVLALSRGHCPLTALASRYTDDRAANCDIYLPLWLARNNKLIFGMLFVAGELFVLGRWARLL